jgi:hypothetical protein
VIEGNRRERIDENGLETYKPRKEQGLLSRIAAWFKKEVF